MTSIAKDWAAYYDPSHFAYDPETFEIFKTKATEALDYLQEKF